MKTAVIVMGILFICVALVLAGILMRPYFDSDPAPASLAIVEAPEAIIEPVTGQTIIPFRITVVALDKNIGIYDLNGNPMPGGFLVASFYAGASNSYTFRAANEGIAAVDLDTSWAPLDEPGSALPPGASYDVAPGIIHLEIGESVMITATITMARDTPEGPYAFGLYLR